MAERARTARPRRAPARKRLPVRTTPRPAQKRETEATIAAVDKRIRALLSPAQRRAMQGAIKKLDREFVEETCHLAIDTALEIERIGSPRRTALLQRNLWASLDALALHLDASGFTAAYRDAAKTVLREVKFTDRDVLDAEFQLVNRALRARPGAARKNGIDREKFGLVMKLAERHRRGRHGLVNLSRSSFSMKSAAATACHRPLGVLDAHRVGVASLVKVPIAVVLGVVNVLTLPTPWWPVTIVTIGVLLIIFAAGC